MFFRNGKQLNTQINWPNHSVMVSGIILIGLYNGVMFWKPVSVIHRENH